MMNVATEDSSLLNHEVASSFPQKKASSQILMRGSLPFKKRRFPSLGSFDEDKATEASPSLLSFNKASDDRPPKTNQYSQGTDDKIAALALVAAAASEATSSAPEEGYSFAKTESQFGNDNLNSTYGLSADLATAAADLQSLHDAKPDFETHAATNDESKRHTLSSNKAASAGSKGSNSSHHQDKRFTGAAGESRCQATTTRGRECAYCAVDETKYCYLHADYDTNPSPRRGGTTSSGSSSSSSLKAKATAPFAMVQTVTGPPSVTSEESLSSGKNGKIVGSKRKSSSGSTRRASTTKNMEKHMADAPYPLLSMLSTDKWYGQKVIVSTGPLANHVGHVEKWGNGWVSVKLPNIGLHNRRSFELYLHPEEKSAASSTAEQLSNDNQVTEPDSEITDRTKEDSSPGIERDIRRCISRDNDSSPTPVPAGKDVMKSPTTNIHEITPLTSCKVVGIDHHKGNKSDNKKVKNIMFPLMNSPKPDTVPESPLTTSERIISKAAASSDVERKESDEMKEPTGKFHLPIKTQEGDDMPLVDLLAKEGHLRKGKFGLLFGTAALERSRRSVHRPTWYEPETSAKKREHKEAFIAEDSEVTNKRKRIEAALAQGASIELVSSSSDEDSTDLAAGTVSV